MLYSPPPFKPKHPNQVHSTVLVIVNLHLTFIEYLVKAEH